MAAIRGRIVQTPGEDKPYKVVLEHEGGGNTEHPVSTMREGEVLIKRHTPTPPKRSKKRDHAG
jgi:hypothetical protein